MFLYFLHNELEYVFTRADVSGLYAQCNEGGVPLRVDQDNSCCFGYIPQEISERVDFDKGKLIVLLEEIMDDPDPWVKEYELLPDVAVRVISSVDYLMKEISSVMCDLFANMMDLPRSLSEKMATNLASTMSIEELWEVNYKRVTEDILSDLLRDTVKKYLAGLSN